MASGVVCRPEVTLTRRLLEAADGSVGFKFVAPEEQSAVPQDKAELARLERKLAPADSPEACYYACFDRLAPDNCTFESQEPGTKIGTSLPVPPFRYNFLPLRRTHSVFCIQPVL